MAEDEKKREPRKMLRIVLIILLSLVVFFGLLVGISLLYVNYFIPRFEISGKVVDAATGQPLPDARIIFISDIDGKSCQSKKDGTFSVKGVVSDSPVYVYPPSGYELHYTEINYEEAKRNKIEHDIKCSLSVYETSKIVLSAIKSGDYKTVWKYLHPDDKKRWGDKETYQKYFKFPDFKEFTIDGEVEINTWKHNITRKDYQSVTEISGLIEADKPFKLHFQKVNMFWHLFSEAPAPKE